MLVATKDDSPIVFTKGTILDCNFALPVVQFLTDTIQPLARHHLGASVAALQSGQGFDCRRRNGASTGKFSEHAFGRAIDIVGFKLSNSEIVPVRSADLMEPPEARFFQAARKAACGTFTTVLGPGSNAAHATHLHLDLARSGKKKNPYRICE